MSEAEGAAAVAVATGGGRDACEFREHLVVKLNDLFNNHNFKVVDEVISQDCINRGPLGQTYGIAEFKNLFCLPLFNGFPDLTFVCHEIITELPTIVMRWTFSGTHKAEYHGYPPTHQKVSWSGVVINRLNEQGRVYEMLYAFDSRPLYNQLGNKPMQSSKPTSTSPSTTTAAPAVAKK